MADNIKPLFNLPYIRKEKSFEFQFYMVPKQLFVDERFKKLDRVAMVAYSILLDRVSLSSKNGWVDENDNVYIYFKREELADLLCVSYKTVVKIFKDLILYGLIEEVRQGRNKPNKVYVKSYSLPEGSDAPTFPDEKIYNEEPPEIFSPAEDNTSSFEPLKEASLEKEAFDFNPENTCNSFDVKNLHIRTCKNYTSEPVKSTHPDVKNLHPNYTNISKTEFNDNYSIYPSSNFEKSSSFEKANEDRLMDDNLFQNAFLSAIDFEFLKKQKNRAVMEDVVKILLDASFRDFIRVSDRTLSKSEFRSWLLTLSSEDISFAAETLSKATDVKNPYAYTLATVWNAKLTGNIYYGAQVNKDMQNFGLD